MTYLRDPRVDAYIDALPDWQQAICRQVRDLVHAADPEVIETIKRTDRPYFVLQGNICAQTAATGQLRRRRLLRPGPVGRRRGRGQSADSGAWQHAVMDNIGQPTHGVEHFSDSDEIRQHVPFPFQGGCFPKDLGAVVQGTVLSGDVPAREVVHALDGSWHIGDGVSDPSLPGASMMTQISHAVQWNTSIAELSTMGPGHLAERSDPGKPWQIVALASLRD